MASTANEKELEIVEFLVIFLFVPRHNVNGRVLSKHYGLLLIFESGFFVISSLL